MRKILVLPLAAALTLSSLPAAGEETTAASVPAETYQAFIDAVSSQYAYDIAYELSTNLEFFSSDQGGRTAGSDAEHKAADWLAEQMELLGLSDVEKQAADCDRWQFNGASLTVDGEEFSIYTYATAATPAEGLTAEIVYAGDGTMWDYEDLDVEGKIVLIDIDQRADWWITYPMLEAEVQGAAAILAANVGGFAQVSDDALNSQDICGPTSIPTASIGVADSLKLQEKMAEGPVTATLVIDNEVEIGTGTTYNITGKIPGKSSDYQILVGGHYDAHFWGFQDDACAVGLVLAMAKGMLDSEYQPENDIIFCLHGAEEWGSSYTQYDWTVGAWEMINHIHPDWAGKTLVFINFELPAYEFDSYTSTYSAPEMYTMLDYFANDYAYSPDPEGCFADGVKTDGYQTYTYSDDFSYYAAGVPSTVNGFLLQEDMETVFPFYIDYYHTQYDTYETYNNAVMDFNIKYYGALALYVDQTPAVYLDFTAQADRMLAAVDAELMAEAGIDVDAYTTAAEALRASAASMKTRIEDLNSAYAAAVESGDTETAAALLAEGKALTKTNLEAFKAAQKNLLGLMYERPIVPHEAPQENIALCRAINDLLAEGDVVTAVDEYAWTVNNVLEWYAMYFSPEVIAIQDDMLWGEDNLDNLYWGTDIGFTKADVDAATRSIFERYDETDGDFSEEIAVYEAAVSAQMSILKELGDKEIAAMNELAGLLAQ